MQSTVIYSPAVVPVCECVADVCSICLACHCVLAKLASFRSVHPTSAPSVVLRPHAAGVLRALSFYCMLLDSVSIQTRLRCSNALVTHDQGAGGPLRLQFVMPFCKTDNSCMVDARNVRSCYINQHCMLHRIFLVPRR